ncbi:MAG: hypothetical protein SGCHY_001092 [Lobulomycetales sp.]
MLVPVFQFVLAVLCSPFVVESATVPDKALLPPSPEALKVPSYVLKDVAVVEKDYSAQCKLLNDLFERQYLRQVRLTPARYDDLDNEVQALVFVESSRSKDAVEAVGKRIFEAKRVKEAALQYLSNELEGRITSIFSAYQVAKFRFNRKSLEEFYSNRAQGLSVSPPDYALPPKSFYQYSAKKVRVGPVKYLKRNDGSLVASEDINLVLSALKYGLNTYPDLKLPRIENNLVQLHNVLTGEIRVSKQLIEDIFG